MGEFLVDRNIIQLRIITSGKIVAFFCSNRIIRIKRCRSHNFANSLEHVLSVSNVITRNFLQGSIFSVEHVLFASNFGLITKL